ncbi:MAG: AbrB/MazE/SpoVT family DNA-binding domain-containing protein [Chloroflexia bacterium]|jgi:antitoxin component of MazEF toxin-antitoxin module
MAGVVTKEGRLVRHGDNLALVLDPDLLEQMNIKVDTMLDIITDGDSIIVTVRDDEHKARLHQIMDEMRAEYGEVFKRLAE